MTDTERLRLIAERASYTTDQAFLYALADRIDFGPRIIDWRREPPNKMAWWVAAWSPASRSLHYHSGPKVYESGGLWYPLPEPTA